MIKPFLVLAVLGLAFWSHGARADDKDGWRDIACGDSPIKQPEKYDGPIQCRRGPLNGANNGSGRRNICWFRQYQMYYGRAVKGAEPTAPAIYIGAYLSEMLSTQCWIQMGDQAATQKEIRQLGTSWAGGTVWLAVRKIDGGYAEQFVSKDGHRCVGFDRLWSGVTSVVYGVYCDPREAVPSIQPYTDDEIKIRVGVAQLTE